MRRYSWLVGLAVALVCFQPPARAGKLRTLWEVDLRKMVSATSGLPEFPVFALRFSPEGRKLALIADFYGARGAWKNRLLVTDVNGSHPPSDIQQYEVEGGGLYFGWAPSGEIVYAAGKVIHFGSGTSCDVPNLRAFIGDDAAVSERGVPPSGLIISTHIGFFSQNCEERGSWEVPEVWSIVDASPDKGLISVVSYIFASQRNESLIVDALGRKVLQRWPGDPGGVWEFADSGKAVCRGGGIYESRQARRATCRDVETGKLIRQTKDNGVDPIATATHATRVVVSDYRTGLLCGGECRPTFKGRIVWDFGSGQELARWYPESQTYPNVFSPPKQITEPFPFAISPDGQYVAEGGDGKLRLYKIEP
jgi:dipeptidyl aminopeptidase/acylaminoacyl peptidase